MKDKEKYESPPPWKKQKPNPADQAKEGGADNRAGAQNTCVLFLNLLGVCGSNKDKGSNDYSVKSMVLD